MSVIHASTTLARSSLGLFDQISRHIPQHRGNVLLYAVSTNTPYLEQIVSMLTALSTESIGCLSRPLLQHSTGSQTSSSLSLAVFKKEHCIPFRANIPGAQPVQVGRWHSFRNPNSRTQDRAGSDEILTSGVNWDELWGRKNVDQPLPDEINAMSDVHSFVFFSDDSHQGLSNSLHRRYPQSNKLGLVSSSTPFVNGKPFSLLRNGTLHTSGAVGLALTGTPPPTSSLSFHGLTPLAAPMVITKWEGNLIHELDGSNPSQLLLNAIRSRGLTGEIMKSDDFFVGMLDSQTADQSKFHRVYRIQSGDPARGSIALESDATPSQNWSVQFLHRPSSERVMLPDGMLQSRSQPNSMSCPPTEFTLGFLADPTDEYVAPAGDAPDIVDDNMHSTRVFHNAFLASSENGFISNIGMDEPPWRCTVPGAFGALRWR
ncbi:hypothetical protein BD410DRAFT_787541 [Rickenella mellea]|uniref:FIST domain-containing protein n=1 Tax=Rickenella mellea TaxID=50990 RepID=A0A4Y7Q8K4_9AGAM|nr:hypothetical protein BD410DRAFT_787541 [Rickenella mellea]